MDFQVGDFVEVFYKAQHHTCRGEVLTVQRYQITVLVYYANNHFLKTHIGRELKINLDTREKPYILIKKWEAEFVEEDYVSLMHVAVQVNDKTWFDELAERKNQKALFH